MKFQEMVLEPDLEDRPCAHCGKFTHIYENRDRRLYLMAGATRLRSKIAHGVDKACPGHLEVVESAAEATTARSSAWFCARTCGMGPRLGSNDSARLAKD